MTEPTAEAKPYKGPLSYEIEDGQYFFGRDHEADLLVAKVLSSRLTLLHAQSGTGKTSLLNARVIPALEEQGSTAFRILLREHPTQAVRVGTLLGLFPPPDTEAQAVERLLATFWAPGEDATINSMLDNFDYYEHELDPRCRHALHPIEQALTVKSAGLSLRGQFRPLFLRLMRATLETSQYSEHLAAIMPPDTQFRLTGETKASALIQTLRDPATTAAYETLIARLYPPVPSLREFFTNLVDLYGRQRTHFQIVLLFDQFEELFTLFVDTHASDRQLWRLRWEFIDQLQDLYEAGASLPLRFVVSMRDEYIAQLDPLRRFARDLDATAFHLSFLEKEHARASILEPAQMFGYRYSDECYANIMAVLVREDRFVEPAPLQIICEKLWEQQGRALANRYADTPKEITLTSLPEGGTRAILDSFFLETMQSFGSDDERHEALEMLEPLVTSNGTRNIVEYHSLVSTPFRSLERRTAILAHLADRRVVRIEQRLGGQFVEITHEFLIAPILDQIRRILNADPEFGKVRWALRTLERFEDVDFRAGSAHLLERSVFLDLDAHARELNWNGWSTELMLRSAIVLAPGAEHLDRWASRYRESGEAVDVEAMLAPERIRDRGARALLSPDELSALEAVDPALLTGDQIEFLYRSQLRQSRDRDSIVRWTKEMERICRSEIQS